ncbi:hypothetical protein SAMN04488095_0956 [Jannaschia pohangensis]|uniref:Uncharacterized protein n=1 Tax=Jannaschia pohangensis TaxID=390807 RepID=A0A1I3IGK2_9RHOB|nr:hypothetical protein SAMN04488095_0956 [Jannaschia pohangensis]
MNAFAAKYLLLDQVTALLAIVLALLAGALVCHLTRTITA